MTAVELHPKHNALLISDSVHNKVAALEAAKTLLKGFGKTFSTSRQFASGFIVLHVQFDDSINIAASENAIREACEFYCLDFSVSEIH